MLLWARESLGLSVAASAERMGISVARLSGWERDPPTERPTLAQLRRLADLYGRPLAAFYLPAPPQDPLLVRDFRRLSGSPRLPSVELTMELRRAAARRDIAIELAEELAEVLPAFDVGVSRPSSAEAAARQARNRLGVDAPGQRGPRDAYAALRNWRRFVEARGALVFQLSGVPVTETRGFSSFHEPLPIIAINSADAPVARIFTLAHELGHLVRRKGAVCDLTEPSAEESWCNLFAGELLVPAAALETIVRPLHYRTEWPDHELKRISRRFWVSTEVVLRRLVAIGCAAPGFYERWRSRRAATTMAPAGGPVPVPNRVLSTAGSTFVGLVLSAFHADRISASTLAGYLGVKLKHLGALERLVIAEAG
ncbi:MAG: ImmA/IrrE family metallo-endopeptidase [Planctomycetes bacterium]|nr:ImmA/IrrE family metallo-endopeptidase [Planctomycetota bacterium]